MASTITQHERAAIEAAVAAGKVRVIPPGVSGQSIEPVSWHHYREAARRRYRHVGRMMQVIEREQQAEGQR